MNVFASEDEKVHGLHSLTFADYLCVNCGLHRFWGGTCLSEGHLTACSSYTPPETTPGQPEAFGVAPRTNESPVGSIGSVMTKTSGASGQKSRRSGALSVAKSVAGQELINSIRDGYSDTERLIAKNASTLRTA